MAGTGLYLVGLDQTYDTIQAAVNALVSDQGASPFSAVQEIVVTDDRTYGSFQIPNTLNPTDSNRLIIRAAPGFTPTISGTVAYSTSWTGVLVDNVPYVTIQGFKIREFSSAGIIFYQSDYGQVISCQLIKNRNFGVQFFQSDRGFIFNSNLQESSVLVSVLRSTETVVLHCSMNNTHGGRHCIWIDYHPELEGQLLNPAIPLCHVLNSILVSAGVPPLTMPLDHEKVLGCMDGNVYWSQVASLANLYQIVNGNRTDTFITSIMEWRRITNKETRSSFTNPEFIASPVGVSAGLLLENGSPITNYGLSLAEVGDCLPSWLTPPVLEVDREGAPRDPLTPTPGSFEIFASNDYGYIGFQEGTSDPGATSEYLVTGLQRNLRQLKRSLDLWVPEVMSGFFYAGDAGYYLYANKMHHVLEDVTYSKAVLPSALRIESVRIGDTSTQSELDMPTVEYEQVGLTVWVNHRNGEVTPGSNQAMRILATDPVWDSSSQSFNEVPSPYYYPLKSAEKRYYLPIVPIAGAPVVITDDTISLRSSRDIVPFEFNLEWDSDIQKMRLKLAGEENLFSNPHFHYGTSSWESTIGDVDLSTSDPVVGSYNLVTRPTHGESGYVLKQTVFRQDLNKDLVLSFYVKGSGSFVPTFDLFREDREYHDTLTVSPITPDEQWKRYVIHCKVGDESVLSLHGASYEEAFEIDIGTVDGDSARSLDFRMEVQTAGTSEFDCMMAYQGDHVPRYAGLPYGQDMTLEYESSEYRSYKIRDLCLSSILNPQHTGFLTIPNLKMENLVTSLTPGLHTTLGDTYPQGRLGILPWAKLDGPSKYYQSEIWSLESRELPYEVGFLPQTSQIRTIRARPDVVICRQGGEKSVSFFASDQYDNPYAHEDMSLTLYTNNGRYPGLLGVREIGIPTKLNTDITAKTDASGAVVASVVAPDPSDFEIVVGTSEIVGNELETIYEVSESNHGNISMKTAGNKVSLDLTGDQTSEILSLTASGERAYVDLMRYPVYPSVVVQVRGTSDYSVILEESINPDILDQQFFVDYLNARVFVNNTHSGNTRVYYEPRLAWMETSDPDKIYLDPELASTITSEIIVNHDSKAFIDAVIEGIGLTVPVIFRNTEV